MSESNNKKRKLTTSTCTQTSPPKVTTSPLLQSIPAPMFGLAAIGPHAQLDVTFDEDMDVHFKRLCEMDDEVLKGYNAMVDTYEKRLKKKDKALNYAVEKIEALEEIVQALEEIIKRKL